MIEIKNLEVGYSEGSNWGFGKPIKSKVIKNISFKVEQGECLGILGESGSGKSTLGKVLCGILKPQRGDIKYFDHWIYNRKDGRKYLQSQMAVVFQDYSSSVNPRFSIKNIIAEGVQLRCKRESLKVKMRDEVEKYLILVGLDKSFMSRFPHELSGGQLQRVCIARALALNPKVILFDEAVSSLDVHTQVQIMDLLQELQKKLNLTYLFITHDLMAVTYLCSKVIFLDQGVIAEEIYVSDLHLAQSTYANRLLSSVIDLDEVV